MLAVLVESGDVLELAFVLLFFQCGNHNSSGYEKKKYFQQNYRVLVVVIVVRPLEQ